MATPMPAITPTESDLLPNPSMKILIVEDSPAEQVRLTAMLKKLGYQVSTAQNGVEALDILRAESHALVLSDWQMPKISGLDLCRLVRKDPDMGHPHFILVTGRNTTSDLVAGMDAGADDFIVKPFNGEEMRVRVQAGIRIVELRKQLEQRDTQLQQTRERADDIHELRRQDLEAAAAMQKALLPGNRSPFEQIKVESMLREAGEIIGDSYNLLRLDDKHMGFYHVDIPGHGMATAMQSLQIFHYLSPSIGGATIATDGAPAHGSDRFPPHIMLPEDVIAGMSRRFLDKRDCTHEFTMVYGVLNVETGEGRLCQAGHPHPLLLQADSNLVKLGDGGFPVGKVAEAMYEGTNFELAPGDKLIVHSGGFANCRNEQGEAFGDRRLATLFITSQSGQLKNTLNIAKAMIGRWCESNRQEDDISILALERPAAD